MIWLVSKSEMDHRIVVDLYAPFHSAIETHDHFGASILLEGDLDCSGELGRWFHARESNRANNITWVSHAIQGDVIRKLFLYSVCV